MRYLCIDYGAKRVGIAVSDAVGTIAFPRATLPNNDHLISHIAALVADEHIEALVIGDTHSYGGVRNPVSRAADAFAEALSRETGMPVERSWELWSTMEAGRFAPKGHEHDDAAAAAFILQRFLDMKKSM
ncbi:MAG TPA: Holliday junction resolvase RuvX [Candidatus Paceibacterota bacterium]|nr:Holliday junction resolvase RuvX [Candidatus Paceibacterota bacterium]